MSNLTKRTLAQSLKTLLARSPLSGITVQNIADEAGVNRKTFYYHFRDIYDLIEYTLVEDCKSILTGNSSLENWQQGLRNVLEYLQENRSFILNALFSLRDDEISAQINKLVMPLVEEAFQNAAGFQSLKEDEQQFFVAMTGYGLVGIVLDWIREGMRETPESLQHRFEQYFFESAGRVYGDLHLVLAAQDGPAEAADRNTK